MLVGGAIAYALGVKNTFTLNVEFYTGIDERLEDADDPSARARASSTLPRRGCSVADDVADTGLTLVLVEEFLAGKVGETRFAVLYEKPPSVFRCPYVWRSTDRWIDFPWSVEEPVLAPLQIPS